MEPGLAGVSSPEVVLEVVEHTDAFLFPSILPGKNPGIEADDPLPSETQNNQRTLDYFTRNATLLF